MKEDRDRLTAQVLDSLEELWGGAGSDGILDALSSTGLLDLTVSQTSALMFLRPGPQRMGQLAERLKTSLPSTTSIVGRLEQRGLVERVRDEADRRGVLCRLTASGQRQIDSLYESQRSVMVDRLGRLELGELGTVAHAFTLITRAMAPVEGEPEDEVVPPTGFDSVPPA